MQCTNVTSYFSIQNILEICKRDFKEGSSSKVYVLVKTLSLRDSTHFICTDPEILAKLSNLIIKKWRKNLLEVDKTVLITAIRKFQLHNVYLNGKPSETVIINCKDGTIAFNKNLLCLYADYFNKMFTTPMREKEKNEDLEHHVDFSNSYYKSALLPFKNWLYEGKCPTIEDFTTIEPLIDFLKFSHLVEFDEGLKNGKDFLNKFILSASFDSKTKYEIVLNLLFEIIPLDPSFIDYFFKIYEDSIGISLDYKRIPDTDVVSLPIDKFYMLHGEIPPKLLNHGLTSISKSPENTGKFCHQEGDWSVINEKLTPGDPCRRLKFVNKDNTSGPNEIEFGSFNYNSLYFVLSYYRSDLIREFSELDKYFVQHQTKVDIRLINQIKTDISLLGRTYITEPALIKRFLEILKANELIPNDYLLFIQKIIESGKANSLEKFIKLEPHNIGLKEESTPSYSSLELLRSLVHGFRIQRDSDIDYIVNLMFADADFYSYIEYLFCSKDLLPSTIEILNLALERIPDKKAWTIDNIEITFS